MNRYLDIISLINSNFYEKNQRLFWHLNHSEYNKLVNDVYNSLNNLDSDIKNNNVFNISKFSIYKNVSIYLSHVYDYVLLSKNHSKPEYSIKSKIFVDNIWKKIPLTIDLEVNRRNKTHKINFTKRIYSKFVKIIPKFLFSYSVLAKNQLIKDFLAKKKFKYISILPPGRNLNSTTQNNVLKILSQKISSIIILMIENKYFYLDDDQKKSIEFIIENNLINTDNDLKSYDGFLKNTKNIIIGTDTNQYYRFISFVAKNHGTKIWRFDHAGEKCFFDDNLHWDQVFYNIDVFITYGKKWKEHLEKKIQNMNKNIKVKAIGSSYYDNIFNSHFGIKTNNTKKVLYIPNSFVSEARQFPTKIIDPLLYDWQKYLIKTLKDIGYEVIYKKHPKGTFNKENNLGKISNYENSEPMMNALKHSDTVICDMAGTAFVEALCAGKDVIYIDMKQRPFNKANFEELNSVIKIVPANESNGIFSIDKKVLRDFLTSPQKNIEKQRKLVKEYWLESV